ncbi:MAG: PspC domain-containing protein [Bacteroidales bacterium]|nr:PspC domain-containing protein [Bacteroidales bacterium]
MENSNNYRRLTRSTTDRRIAGVCGGIAKYLNIDPSVVRILFLIAIFFGSLGFWAYLIVWIAAPEDNLIEQ